MRTLLPLLLVLGACTNKGTDPGQHQVPTGSTGTGTGGASGTGTGTGTGPAPSCATAGGPTALLADVPFATIQLAVDAHETGGGGTIWLCPGTYPESVAINHTVRIQGVDGSAATTVQGDGTSAVFAVLADQTTLVGLTLTGGGGIYGGGIDARAADLLVEDCVIEGNTAEYGAGALVGPSSTFRNTAVQDNTAVQYGGGIAVEDAGSVELDGVEILRNTAELGGGLFAWPAATVTGTAAGARIEDNQADNGGGAYLWTASATELQLARNSATTSGGGVLAFDGADLVGIAISESTAALGAGLAADGGTLTADDVAIRDNTASAQGGGVHFDDVTVDGTALTIENNHSDDLGGGGFLRDVVWTGGSVLANDATDGGGLYLSNSSVSVELQDLTVEGNSAVESGGGISNLSAAMTATDVVVRSNHSDNRGGGLYNSNASFFTVSGGEIAFNDATSYGGGLYANTASTGDVSNASISNNLSERGGGIYVNALSFVALSASTVAANGDANTISGGGVRIQSGTLNASDTDFGEGPTENAPDDLYCVTGPASYIGYGLGTNIACSDYGCTPTP